ncbi:hypothetical protein DsansV1_C19g0156601 [Dioscorea sansibarensis]
MKTFELLLLVVFLSSCIAVISFEEERKITAVGKLSRGLRASFGGRGGGSSAGSSRGGGGSSAGRGSSAGSSRGGGASPRSSGNGHRPSSGAIIPSIVAGGAGSAHAHSNERKHNAAAIGHARPTYISLATAFLCVTILLFV